MKNPNIARALRYYRKMNNLSVDEVSDYLNAQNIPAKSKTIYGWENGNSQPNADTLMTLCGYYHIDAYHAHPDMKKAVFRLLELEYNDI